MKDVNANNFGLLIAYIVPGFVCLQGVALFSPTVREWLGSAPQSAPTVSGFLYATVAAVGVGLIVNAVRWHTIDLLHHLSGVPRRNLDYSQLSERIAAFQFLVLNQFRYYEFYSNMMVAGAFSFAAWIVAGDEVEWLQFLVFGGAEVLLWSASRRTLVNYHARIEALLGRGTSTPPNAKRVDSTIPKLLVRFPVSRTRLANLLYERTRRSPNGHPMRQFKDA